MPWKIVEPVIDPSVRALCARRYPGHPRGCPNHGKRPSCPPRAPLLTETLRLDRPVWVVWNRFDLAAHVERLREKHPGWSWRQLSCCLYWQGGARKKLNAEIKKMLTTLGAGAVHFAVIRCPEAQGVNVTETMRRAGVELEWPPRTVTYQVALVGNLRRSKRKRVRMSR
jgi:predicted metal-binding protein